MANITSFHLTSLEKAFKVQHYYLFLYSLHAVLRGGKCLLLILFFLTKHGFFPGVSLATFSTIPKFLRKSCCLKH